MASLNHPNITKVIDFDEQPQQLSIILELLEGEDLDVKIKKNVPLSDNEISNIFSQILSAFEYAHSKGIVHRDIKPANIYILPNGTVKILDFGIAKLFGQGNEMPQTGTQMGTPIYMSPEQIRGEKSIDHRSDIYSLGVTLYFTLTGKAPYESSEESSFEIFTKIVNEAIPSLDNNPTFDVIINKAVSKDRNERYQTVLEMLKELDISVSTSNVQSAAKQQSIENGPKEKIIEKKEVKQQKPPLVSQENGAATAALVIGIIGFLLCWVPVIDLILGIIAIVLGSKGQKDQNGNVSTNKGLGTAGII